MNVFKYKSLRNFEYVADIFCSQRFYAAQFFDLNDPMEGMFQYERDTKSEYLEEIHQGKSRLRICSFSKDFRNLLLWAHYADGFKGICIEVKLENWPDHDISEVRYGPYGPVFNNEQGQYASYWPSMILRSKNKAWKYEKEVRVLTKNEFVSFPAIEIKSLLLGIRTPDVIKKALLRVVPDNLPVWETTISEKDNRIEKAQQLRRV